MYAILLLPLTSHSSISFIHWKHVNLLDWYAYISSHKILSHVFWGWLHAFLLDNYSLDNIFCFAVMVPGTPSQKLSALLLLWPSFLCLMFRCSGLYYFVTGLFCLSLRWGAKLHTWSNTSIFHSTLGSRWDSYGYSYPCVFWQNRLEALLFVISYCCSRSNWS